MSRFVVWCPQGLHGGCSESSAWRYKEEQDSWHLSELSLTFNALIWSHFCLYVSPTEHLLSCESPWCTDWLSICHPEFALGYLLSFYTSPASLKAPMFFQLCPPSFSFQFLYLRSEVNTPVLPFSMDQSRKNPVPSTLITVETSNVSFSKNGSLH